MNRNTIRHPLLILLGLVAFALVLIAAVRGIADADEAREQIHTCRTVVMHGTPEHPEFEGETARSCQ